MMTGFPRRGGYWYHGSNAGLGALNLNSSRTNSNSNIGFRPALDAARSSDLTGCCQCVLEKDAVTSAIAETQNKAADASAACSFEKIYNFDNLLSAAYSCRKGKTTARASMFFFANLEENIISLQNELMWGMYCVSRYHHFYVFEPKRRLISAPDFRDRVIHRAIINVIEPAIDATFIKDSYACRKGKGTHSGANRAQQMIRKVAQSGPVYALKADIYHYFSSIDHAVLKRLLNRKVKCNRARALLCYIIDASPCDAAGVGIPLGNLTSQLFANIYLHELDRYVKTTLKTKNYVRYMDDLVIISNNKQQLHDWRHCIELFLAETLKLETNSKTQVFPIAKKNGRALDFLGYRMYQSHRLLRKSSVKRIKAKIKTFHSKYKKWEVGEKEINQSITSWLAHASHADARGLCAQLLKQSFTRGEKL